MNTPAGPPAAPGTEADLLSALFSPVGRSDPHVILRSCALPGCQYLFVRDALRDPRFAAASIPPSPDGAFQLLARWMMRLDGDRHRRVRNAFGGLFTARRVERYRAIIAERAAALIDQTAPAGSMDLVADFVRPLPFTVITEVLGVPPDDRDWLAVAVATLNRGFARQRDTDRTAVQAANDAAGQMLSYFTGLLDQRTAAPADDLMTTLAARHADGGDRQDLAANCIFFINAGHQTTTTLLTPRRSPALHAPRGTRRVAGRPRALARSGGGNAAADHPDDLHRRDASQRHRHPRRSVRRGSATAAIPGRRQPRPPPPSLTLTGSTSAVTPTPTSASPSAPTSALAPHWPGCTAKSR
jgi:hypothetical protein